MICEMMRIIKHEQLERLLSSFLINEEQREQKTELRMRRLPCTILEFRTQKEEILNFSNLIYCNHPQSWIKRIDNLIGKNIPTECYAYFGS